MQHVTEFVIKEWMLILTAVFLAGMLFWDIFRARLSGYKDIDSQGAVSLINRDDAVVVDVREESEFKDGHVAEAKHIPLGSFKNRVSELESHKEKPVIVICRSGQRSAAASSLLAKAGFTTVYNLRGGMGAWQGAGLPVIRGGKAKKR
jgi:rhodanese-related sulfurtransferase